MKRTTTLILATGIILSTSCNRGGVKYPETSKIDVNDIYFGTTVNDPYRWLEDDKSEETAKWVETQNATTFGYLNQIPFKNAIKERLSEIWNFTKVSSPFFEGGKYFFFKKEGLQNQSVLYMQTSLTDEPELLLDPNTFSQDGTISLSGLSVSKDGKYLAFSTADGGSDWQKIRVLEIATRKELSDEIRWVKFSGISWFKTGFFYSRYDAPKGSELSNINQFHKVYYHELGTPQETDKLIFQNKQFPLRNFSAQVTTDEKYLIVSETESTHGNSLYIKNLNQDRDFIQLTTSFEYQYDVIDNVGDMLYIHTNFRAPKYKLIRINMGSVDVGNWRDVIPERKEVLEQCNLAGGKIIASYIEDAKSKVEIYSLEGEKLNQIQFPAIGTIGGISSKINSPIAFYTYTSFTIPSVVYKYNVETNASEEFFRPDVKFNFDDYETKQVFYKSKDGTDVPMFIVHKKGVELNGQNPTLLYGYGGFNISLMPSFSISRLVWLENGGVFAMANLRGGGEYGENWYRSGTKLNKQNVFDDFIAAAEYLISQKYTSSKKLAIQGGSNGGLLVGAVINQRPELFRAALPQVGVMDMLRFHKFTIGWAWVNDYGSSDDSIQFLNLHKYSPLHNIRTSGSYPAVLVTTADHDDRVVPAHSFKYIATLQEKQGKGLPKLIRIQTRAGHGAGTPTAIQIEEAADTYAFLFNVMDEIPYAK